MKKKYILLLVVLSILYSCKSDVNSPTKNEPKPDSTSHTFVWQVDTIGSYLSEVWDIWGNRPNNLYATGVIEPNDTGAMATGIFHFDGTKWASIPFQYEAVSVFGFADNDIWLAANIGAYVDPKPGLFHGDGKTWTKFDLSQYPFVIKLWGTSSNNMYAVGFAGIILRYDGRQWTKMESGTTLALYDIWGTSETNIYVVGGDVEADRGVLLHYDGRKWQTLYDKVYQFGDPKSGFAKAIWGVDTTFYLSHSSDYAKGNVNGWEYIFPNAFQFKGYGIRGSSAMNIFIVGEKGLIVHWNGKSWYQFGQYYLQQPEVTIYTSLMVFENDVFIVGKTYYNSKAVVYHGKRNN